MIPTVLVAGLMVGLLPSRWALAGVAVLGMLWGAVLVGTGVVSGIDGVFWAVVFGMANAAVGASVSQLTWLGLRRIYREWASSHD